MFTLGIPNVTVTAAVIRKVVMLRREAIPQQGPSYGAPGGSSYGAASGGYPASDYGGDFAEVSEDDGELPF